MLMTLLVYVRYKCVLVAINTPISVTTLSARSVVLRKLTLQNLRERSPGTCVTILKLGVHLLLCPDTALNRPAKYVPVRSSSGTLPGNFYLKERLLTFDSTPLCSPFLPVW